MFGDVLVTVFANRLHLAQDALQLVDLQHETNRIASVTSVMLSSLVMVLWHRAQYCE
jgi:hypothetical protein